MLTGGALSRRGLEAEAPGVAFSTSTLALETLLRRSSGLDVLGRNVPGVTRRCLMPPKKSIAVMRPIAAEAE